MLPPKKRLLDQVRDRKRITFYRGIDTILSLTNHLANLRFYFILQGGLMHRTARPLSQTVLFFKVPLRRPESNTTTLN